MKLRSLLFVPGDRPDRFTQTASRGILRWMTSLVTRWRTLSRAAQNSIAVSVF